MSMPLPRVAVNDYRQAVSRMIIALGIKDATERRLAMADLAETMLSLVRDEADQRAAELSDLDPYADVPM